VGGSAAEDDPLDGGFTADTWLIFASVDAVQELEATFFAVGIDVVAQGAAAVIDGAAENQLDGAIEAEDLLASETIGGDCRGNVAVEERFVGVDVADARDKALIEERGFYGAAGFGEALGELIGTDLQGLGAEVIVICLTVAEPPNSAEATGIDETKLKGICDLRFAICD